jgi:phenylacetate-coenzyme A ligase PaaK-like adenylate-forming protein
MSKKQMQALRELSRRVKKNSPIVRQRLRAAGVKPKRWMVLAASMNLGALDRLAKE